MKREIEQLKQEAEWGNKMQPSDPDWVTDSHNRSVQIQAHDVAIVHATYMKCGCAVRDWRSLQVTCPLRLPFVRAGVACVGLWEHAKILFKGSADVKSSHGQLALTFALSAHECKMVIRM